MEYRLRDISNSLWREFKIKCAQECITQRTAIINLIKAWVSKEGEKP